MVDREGPGEQRPAPQVRLREALEDVEAGQRLRLEQLAPVPRDGRGREPEVARADRVPQRLDGIAVRQVPACGGELGEPPLVRVLLADALRHERPHHREQDEDPARGTSLPRTQPALLEHPQQLRCRGLPRQRHGEVGGEDVRDRAPPQDLLEPRALGALELLLERGAQQLVGDLDVRRGPVGTGHLRGEHRDPQVQRLAAGEDVRLRGVEVHARLAQHAGRLVPGQRQLVRRDDGPVELEPDRCGLQGGDHAGGHGHGEVRAQAQQGEDVVVDRGVRDVLVVVDDDHDLPGHREERVGQPAGHVVGGELRGTQRGLERHEPGARGASRDRAPEVRPGHLRDDGQPETRRGPASGPLGEEGGLARTCGAADHAESGVHLEPVEQALADELGVRGAWRPVQTERRRVRHRHAASVLPPLHGRADGRRRTASGHGSAPRAGTAP